MEELMPRVLADPARARVLIVHNAYQQRGGEDSVVEAEVQLLRDQGHEVKLFERHNDAIASMSRLSLAARTCWSSATSAEFARTLAAFRPDVVHVHNTFPLISPSVYWTADKAGVPVVQTLHNFRLLCPQAMFLREQQVCEDCLGKAPWRGVVRRCYRDSAAQSGVLTGMLMLHRALGTYRNKVARYIALNDFCRAKFIEGGLPAERIAVKPNFVDFAAPAEVGERAGMLFVGRLSAEKGVKTLAAAARRVPHIPIAVAGSGPESPALEGLASVSLLGNLPGDAVRQAMGRSLALVMPSIWYENFPRTLVEAFASGLPVIASRIGALAELVEDGVTGLLFEPGDAADLAGKLAWAQQNPQAMRRMGRAARALHEREFSPATNYRTLAGIYDEVRAGRAQRMAA